MNWPNGIWSEGRLRDAYDVIALDLVASLKKARDEVGLFAADAVARLSEKAVAPCEVVPVVGNAITSTFRAGVSGFMRIPASKS
jgi:hypothetical protein